MTSHYQFRVAGRVSDRVRGAFPGMALTDAPAETIIHGEVMDLHGVLALIQDLGLRVVSLHEAES